MAMLGEVEKNFDLWYQQSILPNKANINGLTDLYFDIIKGSIDNDGAFK